MATRKNASKVTVNATIDRIEGETAVLDAAGFALSFRRAWLPADAREGDGVEITIAAREARELDASVRKRLDALTRKRR
jgi:hypothetical protein